MSQIESMVGCWSLVADEGAPSAVYTLLGTAEGLFVHMRMVAGAQVYQSSFRAIPDGQRRPLAEGLEMEAVLEAEGLRTRVWQGEVCVADALRQIDEHGELVVHETQTTPDETLTSTSRYRRTSTKQVLVYRRDLKMRKGKIAAQCAHGSMAVFLRGAQGPVDRLEIELDGPMAWWSRRGFAKVVLSTDTEEELLEIAALAKAAQIPHAVITDAGKTEFHGVPTRTVVAIGPAAVQEIDRITGPGGAVRCKLA